MENFQWKNTLSHLAGTRPTFLKKHSCMDEIHSDRKCFCYRQERCHHVLPCLSRKKISLSMTFVKGKFLNIQKKVNFYKYKLLCTTS